MNRASLYRAMLAVAALSVLSACGNRDGDIDEEPVPAMQTANELAERQVNQQTCEQRSPESVADVSVVETDDAIDVATLTPGCASGS